jgi:predicted DNA binding protein
MRKLTIEVDLFDETKKFLRPTFEHIQSYEILETLKIDFEKGLCVDLIDFHTREGVSIHDLKCIDKMEILSVLRSEGNKHTCLVKYFEDEDSMESFQMFDLDLITSTPAKISPDTVVYSVIGPDDSLRKYVAIVRTQVGKVRNMTFKRALYQRQDILTVLTEKQREIMTMAYRSGYYDYPKKISSERLAKRVNVGKTTMVQHLRKAEGRILTEIMEGVPKFEQ